MKKSARELRTHRASLQVKRKLLSPLNFLRTDSSLLTPHYSPLTILPAACRCATHHYKKERAQLMWAHPLIIKKTTPVMRWNSEWNKIWALPRLCNPTLHASAYRHAIEQFCFPGFRVKWWESQSNRCSLYFTFVLRSKYTDFFLHEQNKTSVLTTIIFWG